MFVDNFSLRGLEELVCVCACVWRRCIEKVHVIFYIYFILYNSMSANFYKKDD